MSEIINLKRARKARAHAEKERAAAINRLLHGRSRGEAERLKSERATSERALDRARLDPEKGE